MELLYLGTQDLPIYNFDKISSSGDLRYLLIDWDERSEPKVPSVAENLWESILNQWYEKTLDSGSIVRLELENEVSFLETRMQIVRGLVQILNEENKAEVFNELIGWKVRFNSNKPLKDLFEKFNKVLRQMKSNLEIKYGELETISTQSNNSDNSLIHQKISLQRGLGLTIDTKKVPVDEWLILIDELKELNRINKQYNG